MHNRLLGKLLIMSLLQSSTDGFSVGWSLTVRGQERDEIIHAIMLLNWPHLRQPWAL
jgi:hypothetical protein